MIATTPEQSRSALMNTGLIGRLLFADDPADIEASAADDAVRRLLWRGRGAVRDLRDTRPTYIVLENGTRYTTSTPPDWLTAADIEDSTPDRRSRKLLDVLTQAIDACRPHFPSVHLDEMRAAIAAYYEMDEPSLRQSVAGAHILGVLREDPIRFSDVCSSEEALRAWARRQTERLLTANLRMRLPGYQLERHIATLWLWVNAPFSLPVLVEAGLPPGVSNHNTVIDVRGQPLQIFPNFEPDYYLGMPLGAREKVIWGAVTARARQAEGDQLRRYAQSVGVRPFAFNGLLYRAVLHYRIALSTYRAILKHYPASVAKSFEDTPYDRKRIEREAVACEEGRVVILASLQHAAMPSGDDPPYFFNVPAFERWVNHLRTLTPRQQQMTVLAMEHQLLIPRQLRHLTLSLVEALSGGEPTRLQSIVDEMFTGLRAEDVASEPDYLTFSSHVLAKALEAKGQLTAAALYRQRAAELPMRSKALVDLYSASGHERAQTAFDD